MPTIPTAVTAIWRVVVEVGAKFSPVSIAWYMTTSYRDAFDYLATREHLINKKRRVYVKELSSKHKHYHFDERFAAELEARQDVQSDEFYEEKTTDDLASVQIHKRGFRPVVWRGLQSGRSPQQKPIEARTDDVWHGAKQHSFHSISDKDESDDGLG